MKNLFKKKEFLSIKDINKKVKELTPLKEDDEDTEYNLTMILKSIMNTLYIFSRNLNLVNDSKQELNIQSIEAYLNQFKDKSYYNIKIETIINFMKSYNILSKQEKGFVSTIKEIKNRIVNEKKITNNQIDTINYILIYQFQKFMNFIDSSENLNSLFYAIKEFNVKEYKYLYEYYIYILLINLYFLEIENISKNESFISNILTILYIILLEEKNNYITDFAFLLFCEYYPCLDNNPFEFSSSNIFTHSIQKLFKEEIFLFKLDFEENNVLYDNIKSFHYKYFLGEIRRNKIRNKILEETFLVSVTQNISQNIKLPENNEEAQIYLNDKKYEKFPRELHLPKGPSNNIYKYIFENDLHKKENRKKLENKKKNIILGALQISSLIIKSKYKENDNNAKLLSINLSKELIKIMKKYNKDKQIMRICIYCFGYMLSVCPEHILKYFPFIFQILKNLGDRNNKYLINLSSSLDTLFRHSSEIVQKAYDENNIRLINEINKINKSNQFYQDIYSLIIIIFNLPNLKIINKNDKNSEVNFTSLLNNSFNFFSILVNEYFLQNSYLPISAEATLANLVIKCPSLYLRNYTSKILTKIYIEKVLISIYSNLLIGEESSLNYKFLFFLFRLLLSQKKNNYLDFLSIFLQKNINFEISSPKQIFEYFVEHIIFENNKFYFTNFQSEEENYKINDGDKDLEIYSLTNPKINIKLLNYLIDIIFQSIMKSNNLEDIININKLLKMFFLNSLEIKTENIEKLINYLIKYLNNINSLVSNQGHQKYQNIIKKLFELLYYTNFYINIQENNTNNIKKINSRLLIMFYSLVITSSFKLFPNNFTSKEYDFSNIIPVQYLYISTIYELSENDKENDEKKSIISELMTNIIDSAKNNYTNSCIKHKYQFNSSHLAIFYIFYIMRNIYHKNYLSFITSFLTKFLNLEEVNLHNTNGDINSLNFILFNIFILILYSQETFNQNIITAVERKKGDIFNLVNDKNPIIRHIYKLIKEKLNNINKNKQDEKKQIINTINELDKKINFIKENLIFNPKSNIIEVSYLKNEININEKKIDGENNIKDDKKKQIEKELMEKNKAFNYNYQIWGTFLMKAVTIAKLKKSKIEEELKKYDDLLKMSFSIFSSKIEKELGLIKSEEIENKDIALYIPFLSNLGVILTNENTFLFHKENLFDKFIINLDKINFNDILIVLIKENFHEYEDSILNEKFIIYVKPTFLPSVYSIKIIKNTDEMKSINNKIKILNYLDTDINKIFSDFIIIDFNNKMQVKFFYIIIDILFHYSLLEQFIKNSIDLTNK